MDLAEKENGLEAQELLVMNPLLEGNADKYIWISDSLEGRRNAQCLFDYLLRRHIYIKGFASNSPVLIGLQMYHKEIVDIDALNPTDLIFSDNNFRPCETSVESRVHKARIINLPHEEKEVVIWGSGITGEWVYQLLMEEHFMVKCFIDTDVNKQGTLKYGLSVYAPKELDSLPDGITIIEALEKWKTVDENIKGKRVKRFYFCFGRLLTDITCHADGAERKLFKLSYFWMFHRFSGKKIYIYGDSIIDRAFAQYLKLMDYDFCGFLVDSIDENMNSDCQYIEDILYEENFYIWIYDKSKMQRLIDLGLKCLTHWECNEMPWDVTLDRREGLDLNLGYTSLADDKYPGTVVYGEERETDYKIAVLGSSTSDGILYPFKVWPEILYEELRVMGITIYNCSVSGYSSGQELIKLIRDVLYCEPNMVIVYDGGNELSADPEYPFSFLYMKKIYDFAKNNLDEVANTEYVPIVCQGVNTQKERFNVWLHNIRNMHAIAVEHNIKFFGFCQPVLSCKKGKTVKEKNILLSMPSGQVDFWVRDYFRKDMETRKDIPDYLYNFTDIFDNVDDVYMDICHVNEKANRIIASKIKDVIYDTVLRDMKG